MTKGSFSRYPSTSKTVRLSSRHLFREEMLGCIGGSHKITSGNLLSMSCTGHLVQLIYLVAMCLMINQCNARHLVLRVQRDHILINTKRFIMTKKCSVLQQARLHRLNKLLFQLGSFVVIPQYNVVTRCCNEVNI